MTRSRLTVVLAALPLLATLLAACLLAAPAAACAPD